MRTCFVMSVVLLANALVAEEAVITRSFIYDKAPFPSCHASTIVETKGGLVAAWFGGTDEGEKDVGIWLARHDGQAWSAPVEVADGVQEDGQTRHPCWNPVLYQRPGDDAPLLLFYKVGPSPSTWWGMLKTSADGGQTWSEAKRLPDGILGPVKNKPLLLDDGRLLCGSSSEHDGWRLHMEWTSDWGETWERTDPLHDRELGLIQPTFLVHPEGKLQLLCRNRGGNVAESWSADGGRTWAPPAVTTLTAPNSGLDAVTLKDGRHLLVFNNTPGGRTPLNVVLSDDGKEWKHALVLESEPGEYSYPAVIQASDGRVHITYTWKREKIRHVVIGDPEKLKGTERVE